MKSTLKHLALGGYFFAVFVFALLITALFNSWESGAFVLAMAPLAADRITKKKMTCKEKSYPVKDDTLIYAGALVAIQADGHAVPAADAADLRVVGVALHQADNTGGADGDKWVRVEEGLFLFAATSITQAMVGQVMYIVDDQTVDESMGTNGIKAGRLLEYVSATQGWIYVQETGPGIVLADADATYGQPEADLVNKIKEIINKYVL